MAVRILPAELEKQLASLQIALAPDNPSVARARLRAVCEWAVDHGTGITIDVLNDVPRGSTDVPIFKAVLGMVMLRSNGRADMAACDGLRERLLNLYEKSYEIRQRGEDPMADKMDARVKKDSTRDIVNTLTGELDALELEYRRVSLKNIERTFELLTKRDDGNSTGHVALVGLGGIGKTSLATNIAYDSRSMSFGRPAFIRCERLDTLEAFQFNLFRLRAPRGLEPGEDLGQAVRNELSKGPLFLILDNLLDSIDASHSSYLEFIDSITSIPTLTLLITSRNHTFTNRATPRAIHTVHLDTLSDEAAEALFREQYARVDCDRSLRQDEPDMQELLRLLDGIPLAVVLVAAHARKSQSLADVIRRWKDGKAWANGAHGRRTSLESSLEISLEDESLRESDAISLLYILADLPYPVPRNPATSPVNRAMEAALGCSLAQADVDEHDDHDVEVIKLLRPVRQYILWRRSQLVDDITVDSAVARALALDHLMTPLYIASFRGNVKEVERILAAGPDADGLNVCVRWAHGKTPLHASSEEGATHYQLRMF
ncbi:hypothetical protein RQP46_007431 [Phenoliferia psychrophenolica]